MRLMPVNRQILHGHVLCTTQKRQSQGRGRGFTLIELLVVFTLLALLLTIAVPRYLQSAESAKEKVRDQNMATLRDALNGSVAARGGRRRQNFTPEEEAAVLKPFLERASEGGILVVGQIKLYLEEALGRRISLSSVYTLLHRNDSRKLAPDKRHPQSDPAAQEEWKKNSSKRSKSSAKTG